MNSIKVLVVDDSAFMRKIISDLLKREPGIEVAGTARDGQDALEKIDTLEPDVVTLDVEMPRMDGLTALQEILKRYRLQVVMVSSLTQEGAETTVRALAMGAFDFVAKPSGSISLDMDKVAADLVKKVKLAAQLKGRCLPRPLPLPPARPRPDRPVWPAGGQVDRLVVIGCSTGGPGALHRVIPALPGDLPAGIVVVQHMPPGFTRSLAQRLDELSAIQVKEAAVGDSLARGTALVAPGGYHLALTAEGKVALNQDPPMHGVRPAVDKTFESVVPNYGSKCLGVVMTGMGYDGARGAMALKKAGGRVIAEHESTCVVFGMPRVVIEMGAADRILPVTEIAGAITDWARAG